MQTRLRVWKPGISRSLCPTSTGDGAARTLTLTLTLTRTPTLTLTLTLTKADLPLAEGIGPEMVPQGALEVSVVDGTNIDELKARMTALATDEGALLANQEKAKQAEEEAQALLAQAELAAAAPDTAFSSYKP